jgi:catechol 2,3-dioxygenase-like lactoylglutathione lyase family enzyme
VTDELVPVLGVADAETASQWYARMGFETVGEHRFDPGLPAYRFLRRNDVHLHLSEHSGDVPDGSLVYFYVQDVDVIAAEFGVEPVDQPWAREIELTDPDGNRLRIGTIAQ